MSDAVSLLKEHLIAGKFNFLVCLILFLVAIALLLCGLVSPGVAGAIIFFGLILCCLGSFC